MLIDLTGTRFGRLTPLKRDGTCRAGAMWLCECKCGNRTIVATNNLRNGHTISCGCLRSANLASGLRTTHGMRDTPEYEIWASMRSRCTNPNVRVFKNYGGRGISVCERWNSFQNFYADMGQRPIGMTIDRIDNDQGYSKENCRWASLEQQQNNTRRNRFLTHNSKTMTLQQWAREIGIPRERIKHRLNLGWPIEFALRTGAYVRYRR